MNTSSLVFVSFVGACSFLAACQAGPETTAGEDLSIPLETKEGPRIPNGIDPGCLADPSTRTALQYLGAIPVQSGLYDSQTGLPMMASVSTVSVTCRKVLRDLAECALDNQSSVVDPITGDVYQGSVGLAPEWQVRALSETEQRWVSACMIQRLNYFGKSVQILLEGNHPALEANADFDQFYPYPESTAWGNLFGALEGPVGWVCTEVDVWSHCDDFGAAWIDERVCDGAANCGIEFVGRCVDDCTMVQGGGWDCSHPYAGYAEAIRVRMKTHTAPPNAGNCH